MEAKSNASSAELLRLQREALEVLASGNERDAFLLLRDCLHTSRAMNGNDHPHTKSLQHHVATLAHRVGEDQEAIELLEARAASVGDSGYSDAAALYTLASFRDDAESARLRQDAEAIVKAEQKANAAAPPKAGEADCTTYAEGVRVEARPKNVDELFYGAVVLGRAADGSYSVRYDDGSEEDGLLARSLMRDTQRVVFESDELRVVDGHMILDEEGPAVSARLLSFTQSPQLVQTAVVLRRREGAEASQRSRGPQEEEPDRIDFDFTVLPFDVNQAMGLCLPLLLGLRGEALLSDEEVAVRRAHEEKQRDSVAIGADGAGAPLQLCVLGCGGGVLPLGLLACYPHGQLSCDVVELSEGVVAVARAFFGLVEDGARLRVTIGDGMEHVRALAERAPGSLDVLLIDVADADAALSDDEDDGGAAPEIPPLAFVGVDFLRSAARRCLACPGVLAVNVLGGRLALLDVLSRLERAFGAEEGGGSAARAVYRVYVLATDPNYVFYACATERGRDTGEVTPASLFGWAACRPERAALGGVVLNQVRDTERYQFVCPSIAVCAQISALTRARAGSIAQEARRAAWVVQRTRIPSDSYRSSESS